MRISSNFDSGNIECLDCSNPTDIRLAINKDRNADFYQWFHFRLVGARGQDCTLRIMNAGSAAYPKGWENYRACASYDRRDWFRVATTYDGTVLTINHRPEHDSVYYAYFAPYSMERHARLVAGTLVEPRRTTRSPGQPPSTDRTWTSCMWARPAAANRTAGSSPVSIPARPWRNGGWKD